METVSHSLTLPQTEIDRESNNKVKKLGEERDRRPLGTVNYVVMEASRKRERGKRREGKGEEGSFPQTRYIPINSGRLLEGSTASLTAGYTNTQTGYP